VYQESRYQEFGKNFEGTNKASQLEPVPFGPHQTRGVRAKGCLLGAPTMAQGDSMPAASLPPAVCVCTGAPPPLAPLPPKTVSGDNDVTGPRRQRALPAVRNPLAVYSRNALVGVNVLVERVVASEGVGVSSGLSAQLWPRVQCDAVPCAPHPAHLPITARLAIDARVSLCACCGISAAEEHVGATRRDQRTVRMRGAKLVALRGVAMVAAAAIPVAEAGTGLPKTFQMNTTHVHMFNLSSKLTAEDRICTSGDPHQVAFRKLMDATTPGGKVPCCDNGLFIPAIPYEYLWSNELRAFLYIVTLLWCFVGVSVLADAFMAGIEAITSWTSKKQVPRTHRDGRPVMNAHGQQIIDTVETPMWNEKVACLTLFALGSSAPEILIACVGCAPGFLEDVSSAQA